VNIALPVINKLHSYCYKQRKPKGSTQLIPMSESTHVHESSNKQTEAARETVWKRSIVMGHRDYQRVFCIIPTTPTFRFTQIINTLPLPLLSRYDVFVLEMRSKKIRLEDYAPLVLHVPKRFVKTNSHYLAKKFPNSCQLEYSTPCTQVSPTNPYPEPDESSLLPHILLLRCI
jgi:hypothetical protein